MSALKKEQQTYFKAKFWLGIFVKLYNKFQLYLAFNVSVSFKSIDSVIDHAEFAYCIMT